MRKGFLSLLAMAFMLSVLSSISFAFTLPDTGQTKCYSIFGAEIACAGTGLDGDYNINPMSYTDNGNGTITDNVTGLLWQKEDDNTKRTWADAGTYCDNLTLGGQSNWRLPSMNELTTIGDFSIPSPGPTINMTYFQNTKDSSYWSSGAVVNSNKMCTECSVNFKNGLINYDFNSPNYYVRCVSGKQNSASFTNNGNGTMEFPPFGRHL